MLKNYLKILVFSLLAISAGSYCSTENDKAEQIKQTTMKQKCVTVLKNTAHFAGTSFFKSVKLAMILFEVVFVFELSHLIPVEGLSGIHSEGAFSSALKAIPIFVVSSKIEAILNKIQL